jgi:hypothetical protein
VLRCAQRTNPRVIVIIVQLPGPSDREQVDLTVTTAPGRLLELAAIALVRVPVNANNDQERRNHHDYRFR